MRVTAKSDKGVCANGWLDLQGGEAMSLRMIIVLQ